MDELQKENLQLKQQISGLQYNSSSLASELRLSQNDTTQMELQLEEKEELVSVLIFMYLQCCVKAKILLDLKLRGLCYTTCMMPYTSFLQLIVVHQELQDTQEVVKQLQLELNEQVMH